MQRSMTGTENSGTSLHACYALPGTDIGRAGTDGGCATRCLELELTYAVLLPDSNDQLPNGSPVHENLPEGVRFRSPTRIPVAHVVLI
eukprot:824428-Rhodomonas_salina.3